MDKYIYKDRLVALRIQKIRDGSVPQTDPKEPLQVVTLKHIKGKYLQAHMHAPKNRKTQSLQECLVVIKGMIGVDLYASDRTLFKKVTLGVGEMLILLNGGYGINFLKDSEIFEVKNGPFVEDKVIIEEKVS